MDSRTPESTETGEVILELGAEGGSMTLVGVRNANDGWRFLKVTDEGTMYDLLSEEDRPAEYRHEDWVRKSGWVDSWEAALALLGKHWHYLTPVQVHPDFKERVWTAVQEKFAAEERDEYDRRKLECWHQRLWQTHRP